jgi:hypothetical protein
MRIDRVGRRTLRHDEVSARPLSAPGRRARRPAVRRTGRRRPR